MWLIAVGEFSVLLWHMRAGVHMSMSHGGEMDPGLAVCWAPQGGAGRAGVRARMVAGPLQGGVSSLCA